MFKNVNEICIALLLASSAFIIAQSYDVNKDKTSQNVQHQPPRDDSEVCLNCLILTKTTALELKDPDRNVSELAEHVYSLYLKLCNSLSAPSSQSVLNNFGDCVAQLNATFATKDTFMKAFEGCPKKFCTSLKLCKADKPSNDIETEISTKTEGLVGCDYNGGVNRRRRRY